MAYLARITALLGLISLGAVAAAQGIPKPMLKLDFEGSLANTGGIPVPPRLIAPGGDPYEGSAVYADGQTGQAIILNGDYTVEIPFDLNQGTYPQVTVTAWVYSEIGRGNTQIPLVSNGGSVWLNVYADQLRLHCANHCSLIEYGALPEGRWVFVAGVFDATAEIVSLYIDQRSATGPMDLSRPYTDARSVWIGTRHERTRALNGGLRVDNVRIFDRALSQDQIRELWSAGFTATSSPDTSVPLEESPSTRIGDINEIAKLNENTLPTRTLTPDILNDGAVTTETETEPLLERPAGIDDEPFATMPGGGPAEEIADAVEEARQATPVRKPVNEIECETVPNSASPGYLEIRGDFPQDFVAAIRKLQGCAEPVSVAALNGSGQWIVASQNRLAHSFDAPPSLQAALKDYASQFGGLDAADIANDGSWVVVSGTSFEEEGLPSDARTRISGLLSSYRRINSIDLHPTNRSKWFLVSDEGVVTGPGLPKALLGYLAERGTTGRIPLAVKFAPANGWTLTTSGTWFASEGLDNLVLERLRRMRSRTGLEISHVVFNSNPSDFIFISNGMEASLPQDTASQIEQAVGGQNLWSRMASYDLKAVSIAMVRNNEIAWARGYGLKVANEPESYVRTDTTFDAASISKPVATFGLMQLVEDSKLSLTMNGVLEEIETLMTPGQRRRYRRAVYPEAGNLVQVMQHCASICYSYTDKCANDGSGGGAAGYGPAAEVPSLAEMILGDSPAKATHRLVRTGNPGIDHEYSSANYMLIEALIEIHGGGFDTHMNKLFADLGMLSSAYAAPYPGWNDGNYARGWNGTSVTPYRAFFEKAAAGLVSTPTDLAKFVIALNQDGQGLLSKTYFDQYSGRDGTARRYCDMPGVMALGINHQFSDNAWSGAESLYHGGLHNGYRTRMIALPGQNSGIVVFMTGDQRLVAGGSLEADKFFGEVRTAVRAAYGL